MSTLAANDRPKLIEEIGNAPAQMPADPALDADFKRLLEQDWTPAQGIFQNPARFAHAQRVAKMMCASDLVPSHFKGPNNLGSAVIAVDMAFRLNMNPLMVMQQLYVVHGKPGWSAQFVIAVINASGQFSPIRFKFTGAGDTRQCVAYAKDLASNEVLEGTPISIALAKAEGWYQKAGSKWQTMAEQMLAYRSASFWGRIYAPEMFMGLPTTDELEDMVGKVVNSKPELVDSVPTPSEPVRSLPITPPPPPTEQPKAYQLKPAEEMKPKEPKAEPTPPPAPPAPTTPTPTPEPTLPPAASEPAREPSELAIKLTQGIALMGVTEEDFMGWLNSSGRVRGADKLPGIVSLSDETITAVLADANGLAKCAKIYGTKK